MECSSPRKENEYADLIISGPEDHAKDHQTLGPVPPFSSGKGLPYAPVDWPCPGDIWSWKVGKRVSRHGYFSDRFLIPPAHVQFPGVRKQGFGGISAVQEHLKLSFPSLSLDAFFASFSWQIPAEPEHCRQEFDKAKEGNQGKAVHSLQKKRKRKLDFDSPQKISSVLAEKAKGHDAEAKFTKKATHSIPVKKKQKRRIVSDALDCIFRPSNVIRVESKAVKENNEEGECIEGTHLVPGEGAQTGRLMPSSNSTKERSQGTQIEKATSPVRGERKESRSAVYPSCRYRTRRSCKLTTSHDPPRHKNSNVIFVIDVSEGSDNFGQDTDATTDTASNHFSIASCQGPDACRLSTEVGNDKSSPEVASFNTKNIINPVEEALPQPLSKEISLPVTNEFRILEEIIEARAKLSSILDMDFSLLVSSGRHAELASLVGVLQQKPNIAANELVKLKLLEAIPLLCNNFLEDSKIVDDASNFLKDLETNSAKAQSCKERYNDNKAQVELLEKKIESTSLAIQEIDDQIALLEIQRGVLAGVISNEVKLRNQINLEQKNLTEEIIPDLDSRVQSANLEKEGWQLKISKAAERQAEIVAMHASLRMNIL